MENISITLNNSSSVKVAWAILIVAWIAIVAGRMFGASDLYDKEQPRTVSYTADLLVHHHWILQYDNFAIPETKPPLYTWASAPVVAMFGFADWTLKLPSIVTSIIVIAWIILFGRHIQSRSEPDATQPGQSLPASTLGVMAAILWLTNPMSSRLIYLARSDMLLTALLMGAWYSATRLLADPPPRRGTALVYWLCTTGAAFAKGPMVLLALLYLPLAAILIHRNWRLVLKRSGWWWGVPLMFVSLGIWVALAYQQEPEFFRQIFFGREMADRAADLSRFVQQLFHGPLYMLAYFLPWSPWFLLMFVLIPWRPWSKEFCALLRAPWREWFKHLLELWLIPFRQWFKHPLAPALLWLVIIVTIYSFASSKRADRYEPVFPAMALIAAYYLVYKAKHLQLTIALVGLIAITTCICLGMYHILWVESATAGYGTHLIDFARAVEKQTGGDPIIFLDGAESPLETLLGRHQPGDPTLDEQKTARWSIRYYDPNSPGAPVAVSQPIMQIDGWFPAALALYKLAPGQGVQEYQDSLKVPVAIADESHPPPNEPLKWHQLWRYHTQRGRAPTTTMPGEM